ncbi:MAG: hypothetical protein AAF960_07225 [Bacteroidota bacterium]
MWSFCKRIFLTLSAGLVVTLAMAQPQNNSPYSRFGIGEILNQNFTNLRATPGFTNAYNNPYHLNLQNPASLGFMQMAAFDFGLYGRGSTWESGVQSNRNWSGNLSHLALGFTLNNPVNDLLERERRDFAWGMSFALVPYSQVGYIVQTTGEVPNIGSVGSEFEGEGGTNQFVFSNGFRYKRLAVGFNVGYLFGKIENIQNVIFQDLPTGFQDRFLDDFSINGFTWKIGAQYNLVFKNENPKKTKVLTLGVTAAPNSSLNTNTSQFYTRINPAYTVFASDTLVDRSQVKGKATLPGQFGFGALLSGGSKYKIGVNIDRFNWSSYQNDAKPETFEDTWRASFGAEFVPDFASYNKYWKRIRYRIGAFTGTDPRSIDGVQVNEYGVTMGFGLPITLPRQQVSFVNLSVELGRRGANTSLQETYGEFTLGFTLNDNSWFFKRKFN